MATTVVENIFANFSFVKFKENLVTEIVEMWQNFIFKSQLILRELKNISLAEEFCKFCYLTLNHDFREKFKNCLLKCSQTGIKR